MPNIAFRIQVSTRSAVFRGKPGAVFEIVLADPKTPADTGCDTKRGRRLVPHLKEDTVDAYALK